MTPAPPTAWAPPAPVAPAPPPEAPPPGRARARPRILHRYFLKEVVAPTALALALYTFVMLMNQFVLLAEYAYEFDVPVASLSTLFALQLPHVIVLTLPMSLLVGLLVATARMASDSELVALSAGGMSIASLLRPVLQLAAVFTVATGVLAFDVMPRANFAITRKLFDIFRQNLLRNVKPHEFNSRLLAGFTFYVRELAADERGEEYWKGVLIEPLAAASERGTREVFFAREAHPVVDDRLGKMELRLVDVTVHAMGVKGETGYDVRTLAGYAMTLPPPPLLRRPEEAEAGRSVRERTVPDLLDYVRTEGPKSVFNMRLGWVEIHKRLAIPCACLVFAFLGLGLGARARRAARSFGFIASLGVILVYYQFFYAGERLAVNGDVPPWLAMWAGNLLFGVIGAALFLQGASGGRLIPRLGGGRAARIARRGLARVETAWNALRRRAGHGAPESRVGRTHVPLGIPSLIDRYVARHFFGVLALVLAALLVLYVTVTISQLLDDIVRNHVSLWTVVQLYAAWFPEILTYVLPMSALLATLVTFSLLTRTNEVTAFLVHGISLYRVAAPVVAIGLALTAAEFVLYDRWLPRSSERYEELKNRVEGMPPRAKLSIAQWAEQTDGSGFYHFDMYDPDRGRFYRLTFFELEPERFVPARSLYAAVARWDGPRLFLDKGWERRFDGKTLASYSPFVQKTLGFIESRRDFAREWKKPKHMTYDELDDFIRWRRRRGLEIRELEIEIANKRAFPFITLVMMLLGLPFAFAIGKRGSLYGLGVAIVVAVVYWSSVVLTTHLGKLGLVPPEVAAWSPNVAFALLGIAAFFNLRT